MRNALDDSAAVEEQSPSRVMAPFALGVGSWGTPPGVKLDLRYAPDEAALLDHDVGAMWEAVVRRSAGAGSALASHYAVDDPYGGVRGAPVVSRFFNVGLSAEQVTFGAGVTSLLHALSGLADHGVVMSPVLTHPDLDTWSATRGGRVVPLEGPPLRDQLSLALARVRPTLLHFDRPDFLGQMLDLDELEHLLAVAERAGTIVLIDESAAQYLGPSGSAGRLVNRVGNLIVLRGFTKAYSLGGMRAAYAVASRELASTVRTLVPPLQVSELSLAVALELLRAGDMFAHVRARVCAVKPIARQVLQDAMLSVIATREELPWLGVRDTEQRTSAFLEQRGVFALRPPATGRQPSAGTDVLRLTIPLSDDRIALFSQLLA
ncbi:MAG TPA: aminotransferase class I/II-fold pyridoxal phosphate-dependent enzyme [Gemmatimonadaceae bacterium]|jgi:histidinol-phosphate/aromatic aminotransferase/cobyric acid decarboxylase-like protein|nr:aminotransferase class I/II-fold pyridoxal phosphate-dependent enzyme [Gemmatimonadaceae bacterium]